MHNSQAASQPGRAAPHSQAVSKQGGWSTAASQPGQASQLGCITARQRNIARYQRSRGPHISSTAQLHQSQGGSQPGSSTWHPGRAAQLGSALQPGGTAHVH
ncbi:hypothetical protein DUNSADRAFT_10165 [Dunaliella salina]|uniref:Encoded protein n=1 Tax=Dunaliella salina TaxID=3046 RepID=A0ABQ7GFY9_DUNSA|nr:hypothetical protein DUNSADRAFT_10165 [Dunaliella salina]|eukprot:KAF5833514.1 hypothetical protein DUNSADRAFT_10165 [Dunaliella salina]